MRFSKQYLVVLLTLFLGALPIFVYADSEYFNLEKYSIAHYIKAIYTYAIGIVGIIATVVIMVAGMVWISSMGNAQRVSQAKEWIISAMMGLALALLSYSILFLINPDLVEFRYLEVEKVDGATTPVVGTGEKEELPNEVCSGIDENCSILPCCSGLRCYRGRCTMTEPAIPKCSSQGGSCLNGVPCCEGMTCTAGRCQTAVTGCALNGAACTDIPCCDGSACVEGWCRDDPDTDMCGGCPVGQRCYRIEVADGGRWQCRIVID